MDDTFLTGEVLEKEARLMEKTLEIYGKVLGQKINWAKSEFFFFNTPLSKRIAIGKILNIKQGCMSRRYLRIPLFQGEIEVKCGRVWPKNSLGKWMVGRVNGCLL